MTLDVLIVGGGPSGLAIAARLREHSPSALFSDAEQQRFHWLRNKSINTIDRRKNSLPNAGNLSLHCIDATSSSWMGQWRNQFSACQIPHLRSPMFFHPDPQDLDGMTAFAFRHGRQSELKEITGVVGKELSNHKQKKRRNNKHPVEVDQRDNRDYYRPGTTLFIDYCEDIVQRYELQENISKQKCLNIVYDEAEQLFTVTTDLEQITCRNVILACGPIGLINYNRIQNHYLLGSCHTSDLFACDNRLSFPPIRGKTFVVVGGGLTGAQLCHRIIQSLPSATVHWVLRSKLKVKHFDFDLEWVTKYRNFMKSTFWMLDSDEERWEMIQQARNGGSVNPEYFKLTRKHQKDGRLKIYEESIYRPGDWCTETNRWISEGLVSKSGDKASAIDSQRIVPVPDYVYYATGSRPDLEKIEFLQSFIVNHPIENCAGLPCLTHDLQWSRDVPIYVTGRLAFLRLGPAAANLEGARAGAERIVSAIVAREQERRVEESSTAHYFDILAAGWNQYAVLANV